MNPDAEVVVIGAGTVGLACARELASAGLEVLVLEAEEGPGRQTSSRNSGVVHGGLYYRPGTLKAITCVEGRALLYAYCQEHSVPFDRCGKLIVATDDEELGRLAELERRAQENGCTIERVSPARLAKMEPRVRAVGAVHSPQSGILDVDAFTAALARDAREAKATLVYRTRVEGLTRTSDGWRIETVSLGSARERHAVRASCVVNAGGLNADSIAELAGIDIDTVGWRLKFCKGDYFSLSSRLRGLCRRLVYPLPSKAGLGIHITLDLAGALRAGPDTEYVAAPRYDIAAYKAPLFGAALRRYLPDVRDDDLRPDYAGVRPKLHGPDEPLADFVVDMPEETPAMVHLIGIESPGITASLALAKRVAELISSASRS